MTPCSGPTAKFDHSKTGFTLTGMHTVPPRQCTDCHVNNNYNITAPPACRCHLKDYQGTTNPNHVHGEFPADVRAVSQHDELVELRTSITARPDSR